MDILDDMWVNKLSAKVFFKVNYSFKFLPTFFLFTVPNIHTPFHCISVCALVSQPEIRGIQRLNL